MTAELTDQQLLARVRARRGQERVALEELVRRHLAFVYATARRHARGARGGDPHLADDVTQAVFIVLVRKAGSIREDTVLPAWLYTVTRNAVSAARRGERRRTIHETRRCCMAAQFNNIGPTVSDRDVRDVAELRPLLDDAIARLGERDRCAVLLHYFGQRTHQQVGDAMGISEEAARKRVARAVEKMRVMLAGRAGVTVGVSAGVSAVVSALTAESVACASTAPPVALSATTVNVALLANTVASTSAAAAIAKGVPTITTLAKLKLAASILLATLLTALIAGGAALPIIAVASNQSKAPVASTGASTPTAAAPVTQPADGYVINASDKVNLTFLGVSSFPPDNDTWFAIDGKPIERPVDLPPDQRDVPLGAPEPKYVLAFRLSDGDARANVTIRGAVSNTTTLVNDDRGATYFSSFLLVNDARTAQVRIGLATDPWKTQAEHTELKAGAGVDSPMGQIEFGAVEETDGKTTIVLRFTSIDEPRRLIGTDVDGKTLAPSKNSENSDGHNSVLTSTFDVPVERIRSMQFQTRKFLKMVNVSEISLERGQVTQPKIDVTQMK